MWGGGLYVCLFVYLFMQELNTTSILIGQGHLCDGHSAWWLASRQNSQFFTKKTHPKSTPQENKISSSNQCMWLPAGIFVSAALHWSIVTVTVDIFTKWKWSVRSRRFAPELRERKRLGFRETDASALVGQEQAGTGLFTHCVWSRRRE